MKIILIALITSMSALILNAQNYIYHGDNQYEATQSWVFKLNGTYWSEDPELTIAKHSNGGYLMLSIAVPGNGVHIGGTVFVFLEDGSIIKCTDKNIKDYVDNKSIALYNFTMDEIEKLKSFHITKVRFSIKNIFNSNEDAYTADNKKENEYNYVDDSKMTFQEKFKLQNQKAYGHYYHTDQEIRELFD